MDTRALLVDHFERIRELYVDLPDGLDVAAAHRRPAGTGNSIAWLLWHTARVQDDHVAGLTGGEQAWHDGWADRFDLPFDRRDIGFGHSSDDVDAVRIERLPDLVDYHEAVHRLTLEYLDGSTPTSSTASSTAAGTRPSRPGCDWSACSATACSTSARRRT